MVPDKSEILESWAYATTSKSPRISYSKLLNTSNGIQSYKTDTSLLKMHTIAARITPSPPEGLDTACTLASVFRNWILDG